MVHVERATVSIRDRYSVVANAKVLEVFGSCAVGPLKRERTYTANIRQVDSSRAFTRTQEVVARTINITEQWLRFVHCIATRSRTTISINYRVTVNAACESGK